MPPLRQMTAFLVSGLAAAGMHYGLLILLVERAGWTAVPATLVGYTAGGAVSYCLNHRLTFASRRRHRESFWRFAIVAGVGFCLTWLLMEVFVGWAGALYLPAQVVTTGCVMVWSFLAHKLWTFGEIAPP